MEFAQLRLHCIYLLSILKMAACSTVYICLAIMRDLCDLDMTTLAVDLAMRGSCINILIYMQEFELNRGLLLYKSWILMASEAAVLIKC